MLLEMLMRLYKLMEVGFFFRGKKGRKEFGGGLQAFKATELRLHASIKECSLVPTELMLRHEAEGLDFLFSTFLIFVFILLSINKSSPSVKGCF